MIDFIKRFWYKVGEDRVFIKASALSYTFVLSLIPLSTVIFSLYSRFGQFKEFEKDINALLLKLFMPQYVSRIQSLIDSLINKSSSMGIIGIIGVVVFSVLLLETVDNTLHEIWRVKRRNSKYVKYVSYWAFITLAPLFIALSLYLSSRVRQSSMGQELLTNILFTSFIKIALPWLLTSIAFFILYYVLPSFPFSIKNAIIAAAISGFFWELSKYLFDYYIEHFSLVPYIYGAISVLPMFLIWIYLSWLIALMGAELVHVLEGFGAVVNEDALSLAIMLLLFRNYTLEGSTSLESLAQKIKVKKPVIIYILNKLYDTGLITFIDNNRKVLPTVSPEKITLKNLLLKLGMLKFQIPHTPELAGILEPVINTLNNPAINRTISEVLNNERKPSDNSA